MLRFEPEQTVSNTDDDNAGTIKTQLESAGWTCGDAMARGSGGRFEWVAVANRGDRKIVAKASTKSDAWQSVLMQSRGME